MNNIDKLLAEETGLPVLLADNPLTCVARGGGKVIEIFDQKGTDIFDLNWLRAKSIITDETKNAVKPTTKNK